MCPNKTAARRILSDICTVPEPNALYIALAKLLKDNRIRSIITTNYDLCLEKAFSYLSVPTIQPIVYENDQTHYSSHLYFKIHGSCENEGESMVFDLKNETSLVPWKRELLHKEVSNQYCLFIGYSGRDFEICPEIENNESIAGILWCNIVREAPSKNAEYILEKHLGKPTWALVHYAIAALSTYASASIAQRFLRHRLTKSEMLELLILKLNSQDGLYSAFFKYLIFLKPIFIKRRLTLRNRIISLAENVGNIGIRKLMNSDHIFDDQLDETKIQREIDEFHQLGKYFEEAVTFRRYFEWKLRNALIDDSDLATLAYHQRECKNRGIDPEFFKTNLLLNDMNTFQAYFQRCEYSFYGRKLIAIGKRK